MMRYYLEVEKSEVNNIERICYYEGVRVQDTFDVSQDYTVFIVESTLIARIRLWWTLRKIRQYYDYDVEDAI